MNHKDRADQHRHLLDTVIPSRYTQPPKDEKPWERLKEGDMIVVHRSDGTTATGTLGPIRRVSETRAIAQFQIADPKDHT